MKKIMMKQIEMKSKGAQLTQKMKKALSNNAGLEAFHILLGILIALVLGALVLKVLYEFFGVQLLPQIQNKVMEMFSFKG